MLPTLVLCVVRSLRDNGFDEKVKRDLRDKAGAFMAVHV